jgi:hypothetical protein
MDAMRSDGIVAATERVNRSRRELRGAVRRLGAELARPSSLVAVATAAAVFGFSLERLGGASTLARALTTALHHGADLYVRYRTAQAGVSAEDAPHG